MKNLKCSTAILNCQVSVEIPFIVHNLEMSFELMNFLKLLIGCTLTIDQNVVKYQVSEIYNVEQYMYITIKKLFLCLLLLI